MSSFVIFDTSVFIGHLRTGQHQERIESVSGLIRTSSLVLSELWRGARKPTEKAFLKELEKNHPVWTPTQKNWLESGHILGKMSADKGFSPEKLRDLHFDVLIALTARPYGARLISADRIDFELIQTYRDFQLELW